MKIPGILGLNLTMKWYTPIFASKENYVYIQGPNKDRINYMPSHTHGNHHLLGTRVNNHGISHAYQ